jgi:hypothetical protein
LRNQADTAGVVVAEDVTRTHRTSCVSPPKAGSTIENFDGADGFFGRWTFLPHAPPRWRTRPLEAGHSGFIRIYVVARGFRGCVTLTVKSCLDITLVMHTLG